MEEIKKNKVLECIGNIYEKSKECKLEKDFFNSIDSDLECLSEYFKTSKSQSFIIAIVFVMNYKGSTVDYNDLIDFFDCNPVKILDFNNDFNVLHTKSILKKQKSTHRISLSGANDQFIVHEKISEAVINNEQIPFDLEEKINDIFNLLESFCNLSIQRINDEITTLELFSHTRKMFFANIHFQLINKIFHLGLNMEDVYLYLYIIWKVLSGHFSIRMSKALEGIYDKTSVRVNYMQNLLLGNNDLIKSNLIEIAENSFLNDNEIKLSEKSKDLVKECGITIHSKKKKDNLILPNMIPHRKLIFGESEMKQIQLLKGLLMNSKFNIIQKRLTLKNLPKGMTALLHGVPGTGKTEIVMQLAKETNREIMKVDISQSKSMWFGESEKIIKRIFNDYKLLYKDNKRVPILLFNEADAIFSRRKDIGSSNVAQTENAMQNILLEELETFEGILIATTNLVNNMDSAFERRFLFKIQFKYPEVLIRSKIWKLKFPHLKTKECNLLSEKFNLSGGQIDNVLRKCEIKEMIYGTKSKLDDILQYCSEETLSEKRVKLGFGVS